MIPTEKDWQLFRSKIGLWQESYMDKLNKKYADILNSDAPPSEKFQKLEKELRNDKKSRGVQLYLRRSTMLEDVVSLLNDKVISIEDLNDFSDEFISVVKMINKF